MTSSEVEAIIKQLVKSINALVEEEGPEVLDDEELVFELTKTLKSLSDTFDRLKQEEDQQQEEPPEDQPIHPDFQLLWILSGQQEQAFISYLRSFPSEATQALLANPVLLSQTIARLSQMMPPGEPPFIDGIQHADLNSSNIWGSIYDPKSRKMKVRFQGGSEYEYDGIPENIYRAFQHGNASAKTKGKNQYGQWWVGKNPSLGAAMNQYIKAGKFPYRKIK